jgi:hypothetical protein
MWSKYVTDIFRRRLAERSLLVIASVAFLVALSIEAIGNLPDSRLAVFNWVTRGNWAPVQSTTWSTFVLAERRARWFRQPVPGTDPVLYWRFCPL